MTKEVLYRYLGTNGVITTPIHLEDIYYIRLARLTADDGKILSNGVTKLQTIVIPEEDVALWEEIN